ncbi:MAG: agmatine deiminase family protein [Patescibacteria group bacterium]|jgi:agmatine deiminase
MNKTPKQSGYRLPAEWEKHEAIWLSWPYDKVSFPDRVAIIEDRFAEIIRAIHKSERVELLVTDEKMKIRAARKLENMKVDLKLVNLRVADYADVWFRDFGPSFIVNGEKKQLAMVDWNYNAYGGKWLELLRDDKIPVWMNDSLGLQYFKPGITLEGGAIEVNGQGTLMTTEECLLNENRNPKLSKNDLEKYLSDYLGASNFIWLKNGLANDHTDGHIDNIARFTGPDSIIYVYESDVNDINYSALKENLEILKVAKDQDGNKFNLIGLPLPKIADENGRRIPASYANFYIGNEVVLVPVFGHNNDKIALEVIKKAFSDRMVIGIDSGDLIYGGGTIHCISREQPAL